MTSGHVGCGNKQRLGGGAPPQEGKGERMSSWYDDWISSLFLLPYQDSQLPCVPPIPVCGATPVDVRLPSEVVRLSCLASS
jgi:hypothetical protein